MTTYTSVTLEFEKVYMRMASHRLLYFLPHYTGIDYTTMLLLQYHQSGLQW